ncbi:MAG: hypothetical protein FJ387_24935 [Verrucomicrobia bacterium]|nr:hypothetical protein [Verrucomicrobiota bacterium]
MLGFNVVEASTNLANWTPLATLLRTNDDPDPLLFQDTNAAGLSQRFYRTSTNHLLTAFPKPSGPFAVGTVDRVMLDPARTNAYRYSPPTNTFWLLESSRARRIFRNGGRPIYDDDRWCRTENDRALRVVRTQVQNKQRDLRDFTELAADGRFKRLDADWACGILDATCERVNGLGLGARDKKPGYKDQTELISKHASL